MRTLARASLLAACLLAPFSIAADEVEDGIQAALDAYRAGDVALAKEELEFAVQLLTQAKAQDLAGFLPPAMEGWSQEIEDSQAMTGLFGRGILASARYAKPDGTALTVRLMADNPMFASMAAMFGNAQAMGAMGKMIRVGRQKAVLTCDGRIHALVDGRMMVIVEGDAPDDDKIAYFSAMDFTALSGL